MTTNMANAHGNARKWSMLQLLMLAVGTNAFSSAPVGNSFRTVSAPISSRTSLSVAPQRNYDDAQSNKIAKLPHQLSTVLSSIAALAILAAPLNVVPGAAWADEWGIETEAPTLFTGETVMICKKRGPLGACTETTVRTVQNDNDKASKYFKDPSEAVKARQEKMLAALNEESEGNALIQKLRTQSEDNREKNDLAVYTKTLMNDQAASFGPFDRQVVILNTDGKTFTLLQNPQAMRLKKAGFIEDRKFVIQPSQEVIDEALEGKNDLGDAIKGFFGGNSDGNTEGANDVVAVKVVTSDNVATDGNVESVESMSE